MGGGGLCRGEEAPVAEVFFEADDAVLDALSVGAGFHAGDEEGSGDEDDPHAEGKAGGMGAECPDDGDEDVEGEDKESRGVDGVSSSVVLEGLRLGGHAGLPLCLVVWWVGIDHTRVVTERHVLTASSMSVRQIVSSAECAHMPCAGRIPAGHSIRLSTAGLSTRVYRVYIDKRVCFEKSDRVWRR